MTHILLALILTSAIAQEQKDCPCTTDKAPVGQIYQFSAALYSQVTSMADQGFNLASSKACQPLARHAQQSVLRMILPSWDNMTSLREVMGEDTPKTRNQLLQTLRADKTPPPNTNAINIWQIENCIRMHEKDCFVSTVYRSSTVVLTSDGTTAATAFHNVKLYLKEFLERAKAQGLTASETAALLKRKRLAAFFYNSQGVLIESPRNLSTHVSQVTAEQIEQAWKDLSTKRMPTFLDKISLSFSKKLGPGVPIAKQAPTSYENVTMFGYPAKTDQWAAAGQLDSDGHSLHCTLGTAMQSDIGVQRMGWKLSDAETARYRSQVTFSTAASYGGMSGGAVFNAQGELVAIHSGGTNNPYASISYNALVTP